jgi:hypothetical protein
VIGDGFAKNKIAEFSGFLKLVIHGRMCFLRLGERAAVLDPPSLGSFGAAGAGVPGLSICVSAWRSDAGTGWVTRKIGGCRASARFSRALAAFGDNIERRT